MKDPIAIIVAAVLAASGGATAAMWLMADAAPDDSVAVVDNREVTELRERVVSLEQQIAELRSTPFGIATTADPASSGSEVADVAQTAEATAVSQAAPSVREPRGNRASRREEQTRTRLLEAGWTQVEIDEVYRKRDLAALDVMEQNHLRQRQMMEKYPEMAGWRSVQSPMRESMSESQYESYLQASGRPASARIGNLLPGSAGEAAGLKEGDQVVRYGDRRVFGGGDLEYATLQGSYGEPVTIEVKRDGATFIMTVPRGPIGISSFRYRD